MSTDNITRRCGCRGPDGKQLGPECPKLRDRRHGSWTARYSIIGPDGRRKQQTASGETKAEAQQKRQAALDLIRDGITADPGQTTGAYLDQWIADKVSLRPSTRRSYEQHINGYLKPLLGGHKLDDLKPHHISAMVRAINTGNVARIKAKTSPVGPTTMRRIIATLKSALSDAVKRRRLRTNPAQYVELEKATRSKVMPWEPAELGRFLDATAADPLGPLFEVAAMTGLRRGELCGLRWIDVDLGNAVLTVREQRVVLGHEVVTGPPKTASGSDRTVDLDTQTVGVLIALQLAQAADREAWGTGWVDSGLVFCREDGSGWHPGYVTSRFRVLAVEAGLRPIRLHDLRHGQASLMLAAGVSMSIVSKRLGHSTLSLTSDTYSHLLAGVGQSAAMAAAALVPRTRTDERSGAPRVHQAS